VSLWSVVTLWLLATLDSAFVGFREASGRSGLIRKRAYYRRALLRGALAGQGAVAISGVVALGLLAVSNDREALASSYLLAAEHMLYFFGPYAAIALFALAVRSIPIVDVKALMNITILGPFSGLRPFVVVGGVGFAVLRGRSWELTVLGLLVLGLMFALGPLLTATRRGVLVVD
jgi:hypothetical protein